MKDFLLLQKSFLGIEEHRDTHTEVTIIKFGRK
jgi:hypothetical protein